MPKVQLGRKTLLVGQCLFLDTSFLVSYRVPQESDHARAKAMMAQFLRLQQKGQVELWLSPIVFGETWWAMAQLLHGRSRWEALNPDDRKAVFRQHQSALEAMTQEFTDSGLFQIAAVESDDIAQTLALVVQPRPSLLPWDAYHTAVAERIGADTIVSKDRDFRDLDPALGIRVVSFGKT